MNRQQVSEAQRDPAAAGRAFQLRVAAGFFLAVLLTHLPTFFRSVMDWDESLYFLVAEQWRHGHLPYTAIWDNKPIGIYGLFALFQEGFGDRVPSIRVASVLFISIAAFAVFRIALLVPLGDAAARRGAALFAGIAYIVCSLTNDGLAANTEIFMACFMVLAVQSALAGRAFPAGLLFGLAFMTKYVVLFEAPALAFALLALNGGMGWAAVLRPGLAMLGGAALPLLATMTLYLGTGHFHAWLEDSILANFRRIAVPVSLPAARYILLAELRRWAPLFLLTLVMLAMAAWSVRRILARRGSTLAERFNLFLALWFLGGCIGVASAKSFFDHYFLQILPVMCVSLAWMLLTAAPLVRHLSRAGKALLLALILALPLVAGAGAIAAAALPVIALGHGHFALRRDTPARIAAAIMPALARTPPRGSGEIYVFDYQPIIYSLLDKAPPTSYAFPSVLIHCQLAHVAQVHATREIRRILAGNPEFIIRRRHPFLDPATVNLRVYAEMDRALAARYRLWRLYDDAAVYRLRSAAPALPDGPVAEPPRCPAPQ